MISKKENFFLDNEDIQFHLQKKLDLQDLYALTTEEERDISGANTFDEFKKVWIELMTTVGQVVGTEIAKNAKKVATQDLKLDANGDVIFPAATAENIQKLVDIGIPAIGTLPRYGGLSTPPLFEMSLIEILHRACPSTCLNVTWFGSIARVLDHFASDEIKQAYIPKIATGEYSGSMALTEPDAGSDLASIRSYGEKQPDGTWRLFGSKRFISNGHSEVCLVLAKKEKSADGLNALNLFVCPRHKDGKKNYAVTKLEEKVGLHGSATCELQFDGSHAQLIGEEGQGFHYMLKLMNEARIGVGFQGIGIMEAIFRLAKNYASERKTWGKPIAEHELIAEKLLDMEVELRASRSLCYKSLYALSYVLMATHKLKEHKNIPEDVQFEIERKKARYERRLRRWTPLVKYYVGEKCVEHARICLQIHGGYGFTTEYAPERWLRESLIISLYEGTSQIQALMCVKDTMKDIIRRPATLVENALGLRMKVISERDPLRKKVARMKQIYHSSMVSIIFKMMKDNMRSRFSRMEAKDIRKVVKLMTKELIKFENPRPALLHAERICQMKSFIAMAESVVSDVKIDESRKWIAERFITKSLQKMEFLRSEIEEDEPVLMSRLPKVLSPSASHQASSSTVQESTP